VTTGPPQGRRGLRGSLPVMAWQYFGTVSTLVVSEEYGGGVRQLTNRCRLCTLQ